MYPWYRLPRTIIRPRAQTNISLTQLHKASSYSVHLSFFFLLSIPLSTSFNISSGTMAPSAITPPQHVQQTAELSASAVAQKIAQTAPELVDRSNGVETSLRSLDASKLTFTKTKTPMTVPQPGDPIIATSSQCTDHMITAKWTSTTGWDAPELKPYGNLSLAPTASVLHYATECKFDFLRLQFLLVDLEVETEHIPDLLQTLTEEGILTT